MDTTVTVVRDLRYSNSNIFIPSLDEIHMDDSFSPQLFTHELVHVATPTVGPPHRWMEEGLATYLEPVVRARAGLLDALADLIEAGHSVGVSVEGELGCLGSLESGQAGEEDGVGAQGTLSHDQMLTDPTQATHSAEPAGARNPADP